MMKVVEGVKPDRPLSGFSNGLWDLLLKAWDPECGSQHPKRPSIREISEQMKEDAGDWDRFIVPPQDTQVEVEESSTHSVSQFMNKRRSKVNAHPIGIDFRIADTVVPKW